MSDLDAELDAVTAEFNAEALPQRARADAAPRRLATESVTATMTMTMTTTTLHGATLRRRGAPTPSGIRRRATSLGPWDAPASHKRFSSIASGGNGYGYTSLPIYDATWPGAVQSPTCGFSGQSMYGYAGTNGKGSAAVQMDAGFTGGSVVGMSSYYLYHRMKESTCNGYDCCYGCSNSCFTSTRHECSMSVDKFLYQDDILVDGGFYPADILDQAPLRIRITSVSGTGYNKANICPPTLCISPSACPPEGVLNDLFVTLTELDELDDSGRDSSASSALRKYGLSAGVCALVGFAVGGTLGL